MPRAQGMPVLFDHPFKSNPELVGPMRRCQPRCSMHKLRRFQHRVQDSQPEKEEDFDCQNQGFRQVPLTLQHDRIKADTEA